MADPSQGDVQRWTNELGAQLAPATVHKCHQILRKALAAAVRSGLLARNPCEEVQLPRIEREEMRFIGPPDIRRLADAIDQRYRAFVFLGAYGGLRLGELGGLRWRRIDLERGRVDVAEISVEIDGAVTFGPPKTKASRRAIAVPRVVVQSLEVARPPGVTMTTSSSGRRAEARSGTGSSGGGSGVRRCRLLGSTDSGSTTCATARSPFGLLPVPARPRSPSERATQASSPCSIGTGTCSRLRRTR
jgi:hypothetical protein